MGPKKSGCCRNCRRQFGESYNGVELKQKGSLAQCSPCFYYVKGEPKYNSMSRQDLHDHLQDDANHGNYMTGLNTYESDRTQSKRRNPPSKTVQTASEAKSGLLTRALKGYLWPKDLLEKHGQGQLWNKKRSTTITHMGSKMTGMLRDTWVIGAVEIYEDSSMSAVRTNITAVGDTADAEAQDEANEAFVSMTKHLKADVDEQEDGPSMLKYAKKSRDEQDDFLDLWGVAPTGQSSGGEHASRNRGTSESADPKPKRAKTSKAMAIPSFSGASVGDADTASQAGSSAAPSSGWMFSGRLSGNKSARPKAEHQKDFDSSEKAIALVEAMKTMMVSSETFLNLSYAKARATLDKISARNTPALQTLYRETSKEGDARGLDLLRKVSTAEKEAQSIVNFVSALHDKEASAATLQQAATEAREEGVAIPLCADKLSCARRLTELTREKQWDTYLDTIDTEKGGLSMFDKDDSDGMVDFQCASLVASARGLLMVEVKLPEGAMKCHEALDEAAKIVKEQELLDIQKWIHIEHLDAFIVAFTKSPVCKFMQGKAAAEKLVEDFFKLKLILSHLIKADSEPLSESEVEELKNARVHFTGQKKGNFYEAMTLFPVGAFLSSCASDVCATWHRDHGFEKDLVELLSLVQTLKPFSGDALLKRVVNTGELEIQIPNQSKVFELTSRWLWLYFSFLFVTTDGLIILMVIRYEIKVVIFVEQFWFVCYKYYIILALYLYLYYYIRCIFR